MTAASTSQEPGSSRSPGSAPAGAGRPDGPRNDRSGPEANDDASKGPTTLDPLAGVCAWVLPGLGHVIRGHVARGVAVFVGVIGLFVGGLVIGGVAVVDSRAVRFEYRAWYVAQQAVGPITLAANAFHQSNFKGVPVVGPGQPTPAPRHPTPGERLLASGDIVPASDPRADRVEMWKPGVGRVLDIGVLYVGIAGFLNTIAILDALLPSAARRRESDRRRSRGPGGGDAARPGGDGKRSRAKPDAGPAVKTTGVLAGAAAGSRSTTTRADGPSDRSSGGTESNTGRGTGDEA